MAVHRQMLARCQRHSQELERWLQEASTILRAELILTSTEVVERLITEHETLWNDLPLQDVQLGKLILQCEQLQQHEDVQAPATQLLKLLLRLKAAIKDVRNKVADRRQVLKAALEKVSQKKSTKENNQYKPHSEPMPSLTPYQMEMSAAGKQHVDINSFYNGPEYKNVNNGTQNFQNKHVRDGASHRACSQAATSRTSLTRRQGGASTSTVANKKPTFLDGSSAGESKISLNKVDLVTATRQTTGIQRDANVHVKGKTSTRPNQPHDKVNHYGGYSSDIPAGTKEHGVVSDYERAKTKNKNEKMSAMVGAGVGMVGHVADYHLFKNSDVSNANASISKAETKGSGGQASASWIEADAGVVESDYGLKAHANASVAKAGASTVGIPETGDLGAPNAGAEALAASSGFEASILGARANAEATVARAQVGFNGTPLTASVSGPTVGVGSGVHAMHVGAYVGAHAGEAQAGPFAVRAGVKFGGGVENGVPVLHLGPVSTPCTIS